jgi:short-subunit dehydrogenase
MNNQRTWIIVGATSIIAEQFAHIAAQHYAALLLVGRNKNQLDIIAQDLILRYQVQCTVITIDLAEPSTAIEQLFKSSEGECDLFIAHSDFTENNELNAASISQLINTNIVTTITLIHTYLALKQEQHHLIFLSSVAACRGRSKNSLYGASKAAVEIYLEGLQQAANKNCSILVARLGFIDTKQTYGLPGIFYAAEPKQCAQACWKALYKGKRFIYFPKFWRFIMALITSLPFVLYRKMGRI